MLGLVQYAPPKDWSGEDTLEIAVAEKGDSVKSSLMVIIDATNDAPVVSVPRHAQTDEDSPLAVRGITVDDVDFSTTIVASAVLQVCRL